MKPVFKSCEVSPAIAATIQIILPIQMEPIIPVVPVAPVAFKIKVEIIKVAIAIPETGLLEEPINPTIRAETVAKKNPNITTRTAPRKLTGKIGSNQMATAITAIIPRMIGIGKSRCVREASAVARFLAMLPIACLNVRTMSGEVLIKLMIPPAATAPAPMYLI